MERLKAIDRNAVLLTFRDILTIIDPHQRSFIYLYASDIRSTDLDYGRFQNGMTLTDRKGALDIQECNK